MQRLHIHVSVPNLEKSIQFYNSLFHAEPSVTKENYAKWMLDSPAVNFAISTGRNKVGLNHLGFQFDSDDEVNAVQDRLSKQNYLGTTEKNADCCYANSNKYWTIDPAGIAWEQFHTLDTIPTYGAGPSKGLKFKAFGNKTLIKMKNSLSACCS